MLASTWLKFVFLAVASFAPVGLGLRSGWWVPYYYGALFVSWVLLSTAAYDRLRGYQPADEAFRIITDRRSADRRRQLEVYIPDRRGGERRRHNIDSLLLTQGWAEVTLPERS